ncbi:pentapeptide repeat-containing protein [Catellatospora tritici]|uniref:pentapeptide repeat-containing protein n=1 Tax=Catellatospora tritici TaxID=2851566 RepID=UPI001C2D3117|nr:pentapeptide repeat-containing protein [Catellatospora tritici]MBV1850005.1 pentapeptide repeat-containing protein [Catellatospora tritici]
MKVFISWSGVLGRQVAEALHAWLPRVLQPLKPFFSADDLAKGGVWSNQVGQELNTSPIGIVVVTKESLVSPWVMFEAGALSRGITRGKVIPLLVDVAPAEVVGPLSHFQAAELDMVDMKRVVRTLNSELKERALTEDVLHASFSIWWPALEEAVSQIRRSHRKNSVSQVSDREVLDEILGLAKSIAVRRSEPLLQQLFSEVAATESGALPSSAVRARLAEGGNLVGANLMYLDLGGWDLHGVDLRGANLVAANLTNANLVGANLDGANLENVRLDGADLRQTRLSRTNLWRTSMVGVRHLDEVESLEDANVFEVRLNPSDQEFVATLNKVHSFGTYPELFDYYLGEGITPAELRDLFLWTAHSYPGVVP